MADAPPPSGLLVSMVNCTLWEPVAARAMVGVEKWQLTPAGSEAQPSPMVSVKPLIELRVTVTVMFWVVATDGLSGVTVSVKPEAGLSMAVAVEVDGLWYRSPL